MGKNKWSRISSWFSSINLIIVLVLLSVAAYFLPQLRLDLTKNQIHSLSPATKTMVSNLKDVVAVKVYISSNLPSEAKSVADNLKTILKEYSGLNKNKVLVSYYDPTKDETAKSDALKYGIEPIQFNSVKADKFEVSEGYLGLVMLYSGKQEVLPIASDVGNLEYYLTSNLKKISENNLPELLLASGNGEIETSQLQYLEKYLETTYKITPVDLSKEKTLPTTGSVLVLVGPKTAFNKDQLALVKQWVEVDKKGLMVMLDSYDVSSSLTAEKVASSGLEDMLKSWGMEFKNVVVADSSAAIASFQTNNGGFYVQYPYWVKVRAETINSKVPAVSGISSLTMPWSAVINVTSPAQSLVDSSDQSWTIDNPNFSPTNQLTMPQNTKKETLAAINTSGIKVALIANSFFIQDNFVQNNQQNLVLALNLVDYLSQDSSLFQIRSKLVTQPMVIELSDNAKQAIKWINIVGPVLLLAAAGLVFGLARKRKNNNDK